MLESLKQWRLKSAGSRTYFFDLKETRNKNTMLQITESKPKGKDEEGFEQNRIFLFSEDFEAWFKTLGEVYRHLKANPNQAKPPGQWDGEKRNRSEGSNGRDRSPNGARVQRNSSQNKRRAWSDSRQGR